MIWILGTVCAVVFTYWGLHHAAEKYLLDLGVFRDAGRAVLEGKDLYSAEFPTRSGFRFIYPPFAALLFVPLMWMPEETMEAVWTLATIAATYGVMAMGVYRAGLGVRGTAPSEGAAQPDATAPSEGEHQTATTGAVPGGGASRDTATNNSADAAGVPGSVHNDEAGIVPGVVQHGEVGAAPQPQRHDEAASKQGRSTWWLWALALTGFALALDPLRAHIIYGQINIFLILLVTADVLGFIPRSLRGLGIGIAAGIKITPAAYALIFLVRKDWWSVARSAGFFLLTAVIGGLWRAKDSFYYWTVEFFNSNRGGPPPYPPNQALTGLLSRAGIPGDMAHTIMLPGFAIIALLTLRAAYRLERAGRPVDSLVLVILGVALASPIAVAHHWSGVALLLVLLFRPLNKWVAAAVLLALIAHLLGLHEVVYSEYERPGVTSIPFLFPGYFLGNAQGLSGVLLFLVLFGTSFRLPEHRNRSSVQQVSTT